MFCPKCGQQNPDTGKFCRSCGTGLGNVATAMEPNVSPIQPIQPIQLIGHKGKPISYESALTKIFTGLGFLAVSIALAFTIGKGWWFWMLIPAFGSLGTGVAQWIQLKKSAGHPTPPSVSSNATLPHKEHNSSLPPASSQWANPESRYKTGDRVPPSVTDSTTKHLHIDNEGQTMTLPKK